MPSFYLLSTMTVAYLLYLSGMIRYIPAPPALHVLILTTICCSLFSTLFFSPVFSREINSREPLRFIHAAYARSIPYRLFFWSLLLLGMAGIFKYTLDYSRYLGGKGFFFILFFENSGEIRSLAENVTSIGTQLSYLTWIAAFLLAIDIGTGARKKRWIWLIGFIILINLVYVDRTRPVSIIFTAVLCYFAVAFPGISRRKISRAIIGLGIAALTLFVLIGLWLGKVSSQEYTRAGLPPALQPVVLYTTSAFAYLGKEIEMDKPKDYKPVRITYPLQKILAGTGLVNEPPSQILEFYYVPVPTNVGTFLEPFYADGGIPYCILAILLHTFLFDILALFFLKNATRFTIMALATLCFTDFIAFFAVKITVLFTWIILASAFLSLLGKALGQKASGTGTGNPVKQDTGIS